MSRSSSFLTSSLIANSSFVGSNCTTKSKRHCVSSAANCSFDRCDLRGGPACAGFSCRERLLWTVLSVGEYTAAMSWLDAAAEDPATSLGLDLVDGGRRCRDQRASSTPKCLGLAFDPVIEMQSFSRPLATVIAFCVKQFLKRFQAFSNELFVQPRCTPMLPLLRTNVVETYFSSRTQQSLNVEC